jgi:5-methylcytosine-specific restriction endonuclease McrA
VISAIGPNQGERRKLILDVLQRCETPPCISEQHWFPRNRAQFVNRFGKGLNFISVPQVYERRFQKMLTEYLNTNEYYTNVDALNDIGSDHPRKTLTTVSSYFRDPVIRRKVLYRANGKCEYCGESGFACQDGSLYLESHHIIALADDGEDRMSNVIALCPGDHRRAHFGEDRDVIEKEMVKIVKALILELTSSSQSIGLVQEKTQRK